MKEVKLFLGYAGFCYAKESHTIKGGKNIPVKFHALFGLIQHPVQGWILFDTGYSTQFYEITKSYPDKLYSKITKVMVSAEDEIKSQLKQFNLSPSDIRHIIISHFHADHIGGLKDFSNALFYCSKPAYRQMNGISSFFGFTKGILKDLIPEDFNSRVRFIEDVATPVTDELFGTRYDLFNDTSMFIYDLPGHAAGQIGLQLKTNQHSYFLIADACWNRLSYKNLTLPPSFVRLLFDSWKDFKESLQKVHAFHAKYPEIIIVPSHCSATTTSLVSGKYEIDAL